MMKLSKQTIVKALFIGAFSLSVAACSGATKKTDTYVNDRGAVTLVDTDRESCTRSCNADFDRCSSTSAAESPVGRGQMTGVFGAQADCKSDMRSCLNRCKAR